MGWGVFRRDLRWDGYYSSVVKDGIVTIQDGMGTILVFKMGL